MYRVIVFSQWCWEEGLKGDNVLCLLCYTLSSLHLFSLLKRPAPTQENCAYTPRFQFLMHSRHVLHPSCWEMNVWVGRLRAFFYLRDGVLWLAQTLWHTIYLLYNVSLSSPGVGVPFKHTRGLCDSPPLPCSDRFSAIIYNKNLFVLTGPWLCCSVY